MGHKNTFIVSALLIVFTLSFAAVAAAENASPQPSQVELGDIRGAVVTLYYYDPVTGGKGAIVPLPDNQNPQEVEWDYTKAAPGTYTYTRVPEGVYYLEAVHKNHTWFTIVTVNSTMGTSTANVAIPPFNESGFQASPAPQATPSTTPTELPTATPEPTPRATASPGMTTLCALTGLMLVALYVAIRRD